IEEIDEATGVGADRRDREEPPGVATDDRLFGDQETPRSHREITGCSSVEGSASVRVRIASGVARAADDNGRTQQLERRASPAIVRIQWTTAPGTRSSEVPIGVTSRAYSPSIARSSALITSVAVSASPGTRARSRAAAGRVNEPDARG